MSGCSGKLYLKSEKQVVDIFKIMGYPYEELKNNFYLKNTSGNVLTRSHRKYLNI